MKKVVFVWICMLVACTQVSSDLPHSPTQEVLPVSAQMNATPQVAAQEQIDLPTRTITQITPKGTIKYSLTDDNRIVQIAGPNGVWNYTYGQGHLLKIEGPKNILFSYAQNKSAAIELDGKKFEFTYDARNRVVEFSGGPEALHMEYDGDDRLRAVRRGVAAKTGFDYDKKGRILYMTKGATTTTLYYDDKDRVRSFDAADMKLILGYWRDNKVISFTGKTFGPGLTISYGTEFPPMQASIINDVDTSEFSAAYSDALYKVTNEYVYCSYVRRIKTILFESISYAFYVNYFKDDIAGYLAMQFACAPYDS